jgi:hypothetical protein
MQYARWHGAPATRRRGVFLAEGTGKRDAVTACKRGFRIRREAAGHEVSGFSSFRVLAAMKPRPAPE